MDLLHFPKVWTSLRRTLWSPLRVPQDMIASKGLSLYRYDSTGRLMHYDADSQVIDQESDFTVMGSTQPAEEQPSSTKRGTASPRRVKRHAKGRLPTHRRD